jgi:prepilin-type N-terminal cleavage/methylation domain-containing protein
MRQSGLTLVEILVAITIIAAVFMVLANSQITSLQVTRDSRLASIATQVANNAMEQAAQMLLENGFSCSGISCSGTLVVGIEGRDYEAEYEINTSLGPESLTGVALITVNVREPRELVFAQYVSCLDAETDPRPSFNNPGPCE